MNPRLLPALLLLASLSPYSAHAQDQLACPWFTAGTAAATLGGPTLSAVKLTDSTERPDGSCTFTLSQGVVLSTLEIVVTRSPKPACPSDSPKLTGIGNEATICRLDRSTTQLRYAIDSRVRDLYLRASLTIQGGSPTSKSTPNQQQLLERVAEQVAGNLY
jgi:hypothetical protein